MLPVERVLGALGMCFDEPALSFLQSPLYILSCLMKSKLHFPVAGIAWFTLSLIGFADPPAATLKIAGVFEAVVASDISQNTEHLKSFVISKIVSHGTTVSKGQTVVWFESENLDLEIRKAEVDLRLSGLTLDEEEFSYKQFLETQQLDRDAAKRTKRKAQQDHDNFVKVDRDRQLKTAEFNLKSSAASLANAAEELKQLEQMYKEDDLTEESEEIVLKRAKQSVEAAEYRLEGTRIQTLRTVNQTVPQSDNQHAATLSRAAMAYEKAMHSFAGDRVRHEIEITRKREQFKDEEQKVQEMRQERKQIVLKAPHDGIVLYGGLQRGKLSDKESTLQSGSKVANNQVIATVVGTGRLRVRIDLSEDALQTVVVGAECGVRPKAFPDVTLAGTVKSVSRVPFAGAKYDCVITFRHRNNISIVPAMTCDVEFAVPSKSDKGDSQRKADKE